jgi:hypothetical protein
MDRSLSPENWEAIATGIKDEVDWCCEFCGRACIQSGESDEDFMKRICTTGDLATCPTVAEYREFPRRYLLTVAHLDHVPGNCDRENLKALCAPCHCRYDLKQMGRKQFLKRERQGQLRIDWELAQKLEGLQLALFPGVEPYWLENPKTGCKKSSQAVEKVSERRKRIERRHTPKGMASGWLKERKGNTKRRNPTTSYYYCWETREGDGYKRHQVYVPVRVIDEVRRMINRRQSVEAILEIILNIKM